MTFHRITRTLTALGLLALTVAPHARAQEKAEAYPSRPIKVMIGFAPGGSTDGPMRVLAEQVGSLLKQTVIIENKPGAGGVVPTQTLQSTTPDGYTLAIAPANVYRLPYTTGIKWDPAKDLTYIIGITGYAFGIVVPATSSIKTMQDFVDQAKARPGQVSYGTPGIATTNHLTMEQISRHFGIQLNHIPYKGSAECLQALLGSQVDATAETSAFVPFVESGKLRLIAVWGAKRMARFPDVPTLKEVGVNIVQNSPWGLVAPKGLDPAITSKLHDAFRQAMETREFKEVLAKYDMELDYRSSKDYQAFAVEAMKREKATIEALGLTFK